MTDRNAIIEECIAAIEAVAQNYTGEPLSSAEYILRKLLDAPEPEATLDPAQCTAVNADGVRCARPEHADHEHFTEWP